MFKDREAHVQIAGMLFKSENFEILWNYSAQNNDAPASFNISIANLSRDTINSFKLLDTVTLSFGYDGDIGLFSTGFIDVIEPDRNGTDHWVTIKCIEAEASIQERISRSYSRGTTAGYIVKDLCSMCGLNVRQLELREDKTYPSGYNLYSKPVIALKEIVDDCGSTLKIEGNSIKIYHQHAVSKRAALIKFSSGLLEIPVLTKKHTVETDQIDYDVCVSSLPFNTIKKGDLIKVECEELNAHLVVVEMDISDWEAEYRCLEV